VTLATWVRACALTDLTPDRGAAVLIDGAPVAIFRLSGIDELFALHNVDPFSGASVMSRGIVGSRGDALTVAAPVYKQRFELRTGACIDRPDVVLRTYEVRVVDGWVEIAVR
jgi:nitrite reductase (NADH) small subunit